MTSPFRTVLILPQLLGLCLGAVITAQGDEIKTLEDLRAAREALKHQPRRLIANNDGCDCLYFPKDLEPTAANFLSRRTTALTGSQVDAIAYCTISSGFGHFSHNTKVGAVMNRQGEDYGIRPDDRNITPDLIAQGTDPLAAVTAFAHANGMESFWSFRMNDTHDVAHRPDKPYFLFPELKEQHPDWLVGNYQDRTKHGRWSSVDYAVPEIRDLAFRFVEEVCQNYEVDGIELDFFRHLTYFKSTAFGGNASAEECAMMTELIRRIRATTEEAGLMKKRPILLAVRVPDSAGYSRDMGLDIEQWMQEGLIDILITTDYFRLQDWRESVALGHRHGVKVYPALTDPRVKDESRFKRSSTDAYRARAANAWASGADGLYFFNLYDIDRQSPLWHELGDPEALRFSDKLYFVTDVDGNPDSWLANGKQYQDIPILTPAYPSRLQTGEPFSTTLVLGEDTPTALISGYTVESKLHLDIPGVADPNRLRVSLNDEALSSTPSPTVGWLDFSVPAEALRKGDNHIEITMLPAPAKAAMPWLATYDGETLPSAQWRRDSGSERIHETIEGGALFLADRGEQGGDYRYYRYSWGADPVQESVVEARVKVGHGTSYLIMTNGVSGERLRIGEDGISLYHTPKKAWKMDTTADFHLYRVTLKGEDLQVFVDGKLRIDAPGSMKPRDNYPRNEVCFGTANSPDTGEAWWDAVRVRAAKKEIPLRDIALTIDYEKK